eukprot:jgi/Psemu1/302161/fgenesh1_kg.59_\
MFTKIVVILSFLLQTVDSFAPVSNKRKSLTHQDVCLNAKKSSADAAPQPSLAVGTFVEFEEKQHRVHIGKIAEVEHKSNGGTRYSVEDSDGHHFNIADKAVHFSINPPNSPGPANQLYRELVDAHKASEEELQSQLDISPELLELAWEEYEDAHDTLTPNKLIELVHSHAASAIETYQAWRLLQSDLAHVFFKDIKEHGRTTSFKVKARKAVESAKQAFCNSHTDSDLCLV